VATYVTSLFFFENKYSEHYFIQIAIEASPDRVCSLVFQQCAASRPVVRVESSTVDLNLDSCTVCTEIATLVESAISTNQTEAEVITLTNELCKGLLFLSSLDLLIIC
jgi:hypothetical protein